MIIATMSCEHLDIAPSPMILSLIESLDCETRWRTPAAAIPTDLLSGRRGDCEIVGAAQVDRRGRVNTIARASATAASFGCPGRAAWPTSPTCIATIALRSPSFAVAGHEVEVVVRPRAVGAD